MSTTIEFSGSIPQHYQDLLTPFLFDGFSTDLLQRIDFDQVHNILELASGTGSVTRKLIKHLSPETHLTATDLEQDMLEVAKAQTTASNVSWNVVDMTNIPYGDEQFDLIVCQFGLMLVPDKLKALTEMNRVLKKGGRLIFSVWGDIRQNPVWNISGQVIESFLGGNPMLQDPGPFSLSAEADSLGLLIQAGFSNVHASSVKQTGQIESVALAAKGFIQGLPVFMAINKKAPAMIPQIQEALAAKLNEQLGNNPLISPLQAWVFECTK